MSSNSTFFDSKKHWLVPMLLLLLVAAIAIVLSGGVNVDDKPATEPLSTNNSDEIEPVAPAIYDGPATPAQPFLRVPTHGTIRGRVSSAKWAMWPSEVVVELILLQDNSVVAKYGCHREENNFIFENVKFGDYRLRLSGDSVQRFEINVHLDVDSANIFQAMALRNTASISGIVHDTAGNVAVNVQVVARFQHDSPGHFSAPLIANTDSKGNFTIIGVRPGLHKVFVGSEYSPLSEVQLLNVSENSPDAWAQFTINQFGTASVYLNISNAADDQAKEFSKLRVSAERLSSDPKFQLSITVNENGVAQFNALPPGRYSFTAYGGSYRRTHYTASVLEGKNSDVKITVRKN
ncbi:MAG: hypothetical protein ACI84O_000025 [Myxococcota bacterium]